ncbi:MAG TPA: hypothetical protein DDY16_05180 [Tenacibaculum sp.]|nr:hypothetical protein [Tenacibaculum sp.]
MRARINSKEAVSAIGGTTISSTTMAASTTTTTRAISAPMSTTTARMAARSEVSLGKTAVPVRVPRVAGVEEEGVWFIFSLERVIIFGIVFLNLVGNVCVCLCVSLRLSWAKRVLKKPLSEGKISGESYPPLLV